MSTDRPRAKPFSWRLYAFIWVLAVGFLAVAAEASTRGAFAKAVILAFLSFWMRASIMLARDEDREIIARLDSQRSDKQANPTEKNDD